MGERAIGPHKLTIAGKNTCPARVASSAGPQWELSRLRLPVSRR